MQNIRIGNDFPIEWRIYRLGEPEILHNEDVSVRLFDSFMKPVPFEYYVEDNQVSGIFEGRNQKRTGAYTLKLVKNYGQPNMVTIDEVNAFTLVQHSYQEGGGTAEPGVTINHVDLTTEMSIATNGIDGDSAYKLALKHGFDGNEEEWLASLVGADGKDGKSAYECAVKLGFEGTEEEWLSSLKGADGKSTYDLVKEHTNYEGTEEEFAKEQIKKVVTSDKIPAQTLDISNPDIEAVLYTPQSKTEAQQTQARININAANLDNEIILEDADIEAMAADPSLFTSAVRVTPQTWARAEALQAQKNIHVADEDRVKYLEEKMAILDATGVTVIGDITLLKTTNKDYIVDAINENWEQIQKNKTHIGEMDELIVKNADGTNVDDLVTAINILKNSNGMKLVEEPVPNLDMVKTYSIYNGVDEDGEDILVGHIDIPLDKVAITGEVVIADGTEVIGIDPTDGSSLRAEPGERYLVITVKNEANKIWIALSSLDYTAKQPPTAEPLQVQVAIDKTLREISATIGEDTIGHIELDKKTEHELDFTGYNHDLDNPASADFGKPQLTTTAQTLREAVNELDILQGDKSHLPYINEKDEDNNPICQTITENIERLFKDKANIIHVEALPTINSTVSESNLYVLHEKFDATDANGDKIPVLDAEGNQKTDPDSGDLLFEEEEYYTPYVAKGGAWVALYHRHEHETDPIDFDNDITW